MSIDTQVSSEERTVEVLQTPPAQITVSQILNDLETGNDRMAIKAKYGLTTDELKMIFTHPTLKKARVKKVKVMRFTLVDDTVDAAQTSIPVEIEEPNVDTHMQKLLKTPSLVEVQSFPSSGGWDNQTRVEEGLDHKGDNNSYNTEIQD